MNDQTTAKKPRKIIDLDDILGEKSEAADAAQTNKGAIKRKAGWDLDDLVNPHRPAWESLFQAATVAAIRIAAEAEGVAPETYIELATLRQLAAENG